MQVMKLGGSCLRDKSGFIKMVEVLRQNNNEPLIMVVSAFSSATRKLKKAAITAENGDHMEAVKIIDDLGSEHYHFCDILLDKKENRVKLKSLYDEGIARIKQYLKGISITEDLTPRTLDIVLSFGELFALKTIHSFLTEQGFDAYGIDSTKLIISDDNYGKAKPNLERSTELIEKNLKPILNGKRIILTQGFVAMSETGEITTMGMESSNLTAVILAALLNCRRLTFWTNVEGIRNIDPLIAGETECIPSMSYDLAYQAAKNGLKLIYPLMIDYARKYNIELIFRSVFNPGGEHTVISPESENIKKLTIINSGNTIFSANISSNEDEVRIKEELKKVALEGFDDALMIKYSDTLIMIFPSNHEHLFQIKDQNTNIKKNISVITQYSIFENEIPDIRKILTGNDIMSCIEKKDGYFITRLFIADDKSKEAVREIL